jgi:hypothetical protein
MGRKYLSLQEDGGVVEKAGSGPGGRTKAP